jgi:hypothetical protein
MRALIVYESMSGNTRDIALAIADGLSPTVSVEVVPVGAAPTAPDPDVDLLIVGAPTVVLGLSTPRTRSAASARAFGPGSPSGPGGPEAIGLREWLQALPHCGSHRDALTFDTRLRVRGMPGSASKDAAKRLRKRGYRLLWPSKTFHVVNPSGPLIDGELEEARLWGRWIRIGLDVKQARL